MKVESESAYNQSEVGTNGKGGVKMALRFQALLPGKTAIKFTELGD